MKNIYKRKKYIYTEKGGMYIHVLVHTHGESKHGGETHDHPKKDAYGRGLIHQKEHT